MKFAALSSALLYGAALFFATPAIAPAEAGELSAEAREELSGMREGDLGKLIFHDAPKKQVEAVFINESGNHVAFADFAGKVTLVNLWATWCPPCRKEMPSIDRLKAATDGTDVEVIAINLERGGRAKARGFFDDNGIRHLRLYSDETNALGPKLGVLGLPVTLILDRDGREIARMQGDAEWDSDAAKALLARVAELTAQTGG